MSIESNKAISRRIAKEVLEEGRTDTMGELFAPNFHSHAWSPMYGAGLEGVRGTVRFSAGAFSNVRCEITTIIADQDEAATFFTYYAEHTGDMFGVPVTGKSFIEPIVHRLRFEDGKVVEHWRVENELTMMKQLGLWPDSFEYEPVLANNKH